jgi:Domain of unknown function (DUF2383)
MQTTAPAASPGHPLASAAQDALITLHDRTVDAAKGYATMVEKAEPSFRDTAERFRALHAHQSDAMARLLSGLGIETGGGGTIMGQVNRAVVSLRAVFDEIDADVMTQIRSGEDWVLKAFDTAINAGPGQSWSAQLREMRHDLTSLLAETRDLG